MTVTLSRLNRTAAACPEAKVVDFLPGARRLITVASGKGGVGKTWFAATLSQCLARRGRKVLLFDGDLGLANVDIQLGLLPQHDVSAVLSGRLTLRDVITPYGADGLERGFDVIAGRSGSGALARWQSSAVYRLRDDLFQIASQYDHVVLDLAAGVDTAVTMLSDHGGRIYVVVTPDPTSITDAYAFIKLMHQRRADGNFNIVINMAKDRAEASRTYEAITRATEAFLKITPRMAGFIRRDKAVTMAIRRQTPLLAYQSGSPAAVDVAAIADKLLT